MPPVLPRLKAHLVSNYDHIFAKPYRSAHPRKTIDLRVEAESPLNLNEVKRVAKYLLILKPDVEASTALSAGMR